LGPDATHLDRRKELNLAEEGAAQVAADRHGHPGGEVRGHDRNGGEGPR
jgi:hypothetical protein